MQLDRIARPGSSLLIQRRARARAKVDVKIGVGAAAAQNMAEGD
jgi:hypothetical protein